jgi:hypothetical protein
MFTFEALQAQHGDCFLLRWTGNKLAVIDGGPSGVYPILKERLDTLAGGKKLAIDLMMVSHIDDDHINGLLALMTDLRDLKDEKKPLPYDIRRFWFNSFEEVIGAKSKKAEDASLSALASNSSEMSEWAKLMSDERATAVLASVGQGRKLRDLIALFGLQGNQPFDDVAVGSKDEIDIDGLAVTVVGPLDDQLDALRKEWKKAPKSSKAELADYIDTSTANLSSIVCLIDFDGKKILLTGDARGDYILDGLHKYGLLKGNGPLTLDLLKVPHHGSNRDVAPDFFEALPAKNYVISANGKYNNPDKDTLQWLIEARGDAEYTIHLTNKLPWMAAFFNRMKEGRNFEVNYRGEDDSDIIEIKL